MSFEARGIPTVSSETTASQDFRSVVLRGQNVASYKFALAKSILSLLLEVLAPSCRVLAGDGYSKIR